MPPKTKSMRRKDCKVPDRWARKTKREQEELCETERNKYIQYGDEQIEWKTEERAVKEVVLLWVHPQVYPARWGLQESWPSSCCIRESHMQTRQLGQRSGVRGHGGVCGMGMCGLKYINATFTQWCYFTTWTEIKTAQWKHMQWHSVILVIRHLDLDKFPIIHKKYV